MQQLLFYREHESGFLALLEFNFEPSGKETLIQHILGVLHNHGTPSCPCVDTSFSIFPKVEALSIVINYADGKSVSDHRIIFECPWRAT